VKYPGRERIAVWQPGHELIVLPTVLPGEPTSGRLAVLS
jgi:hypothetical protein